MAIVSTSENHKFTMDDMIAAMTEISETMQNIKKEGAPMPFDDEDLTFLRKAYGLVVNRKGREEFLRELFNRYPRQAFHGLGITKADLLNNLPLFTCDSTAWLKCRRKGKEVILTPTGQEQRPDLPIGERVAHSLRFLKSLGFSGRWKGKVMVGQQVALSI